jgi:Mn2+/Fe2+ NRAMP family transporter
MLLFLAGCAAPTEPQKVNYNLQFVKDVDTIFVDMSDKQITETQVTKHIGAVTNIRSRRMVLIKGNIYMQVNSGFNRIDTLATVNSISYTHNGYVGTVFGAFPNMVGMTATIVATVVDDIRTKEEYQYPHLRRILATDTMRIVILPRK